MLAVLVDSRTTTEKRLAYDTQSGNGVRPAFRDRAAYWTMVKKGRG